MRLPFIAVVTLLLNACSTIQTQQHPTDIAVDPEVLWLERQANLRALRQWEIRGRTAINQDGEAWNAGLNWREMNGVYRIKLMGPFSQGGVHLDGTPEQVVLTLSDGQMIAA